MKSFNIEFFSYSIKIQDYCGGRYFEKVHTYNGYYDWQLLVFSSSADIGTNILQL